MFIDMVQEEKDGVVQTCFDIVIAQASPCFNPSILFHF